MSYAEHKAAAGKPVIGVGVVTCSDSRTLETDDSGKLIKRLLEEAGHKVACYAIVPDDAEKIRETLHSLGRRADVRAVIFNGGTGVSRRDNTFDAVAGMLTKTLPGFGEIFRTLSFQSIGTAAMLSRATAGTYRGEADGQELWKIVFSVPGSPNAVELAMTRLILPELPHLVWETLR